MNFERCKSKPLDVGGVEYAPWWRSLSVFWTVCACVCVCVGGERWRGSKAAAPDSRPRSISASSKPDIYRPFAKHSPQVSPAMPSSLSIAPSLSLDTMQPSRWSDAAAPPSASLQRTTSFHRPSSSSSSSSLKR